MRRFGSDAGDMREMVEPEISCLGLELLIVISKAYLKGYPLGKYRKKAVVSSAEQVARSAVHWTADRSDRQADGESKKEADVVFRERVHLLAVMSKAFAQGCPMGRFRKKALQDNIDFICDAITFNPRVDDVEFLKVA